VSKRNRPEAGTNGVSDKDFQSESLGELLFDQTPEPPELFEFTCTKREKVDGLWRYYVQPVDEYEDLDFAGHEVLINGVVRRCKTFLIEEGHVIIFTDD